jgi:hypothetical protein
LERSLDKRGAATGSGASVEAGLDIVGGWTRGLDVLSTRCATPFKTKKCERKGRAKPEVRRKRATRCSLKAVYRRLTTWGSMLFLGDVIINTGCVSFQGPSTIVSRDGR